MSPTELVTFSRTPKMSRIHSTVFGSERVNERMKDRLPMTNMPISIGIFFCMGIPPLAMLRVHKGIITVWRMQWGDVLISYAFLVGFMRIYNGL